MCIAVETMHLRGVLLTVGPRGCGEAVKKQQASNNGDVKSNAAARGCLLSSYQLPPRSVIPSHDQPYSHLHKLSTLHNAKPK